MIQVAVATRPYPGEAVNGDLCCVQHAAGACRVTLIDGLGHGEEAAAAAWAAEATLQEHPELPPGDALQLCHRALARTRGAAVTIARIEPARAELSYAGVGNVEGWLWQEGREQRLMIHRGIVGATMPRLRQTTLALAGDWYLLLHSDGVSSRLALDRRDLVAAETSHELAEQLLARWARTFDDATIVIVCPSGTRG